MRDALAVVEKAETRVNSLSDLACPDGPGNPFEPTISKSDTFIRSEDLSIITLNRPALSYGFKTFGLVRTFIRQPVDDAFRGGIDIEIPEIDDAEELKELHDKLETEGDLDVVKNVATWARLFGGAGLVIVTEQEPMSELSEDAIKPGARLKFLSADRWELTMAGFNNAGEDFDKLAGRQYGYSYASQFNYYGIPLDDSRVVKMLGQEAPSLVRQRLQGWGLSDLEQCMREIQTYIKFQNLLFELVDEAKVDVYGIEGFNDQLASAQGTALIKLRVSLGNWIKNYKNALVMDKNDVYEQKQLSFGGLADIFEEFRINLCAALRFPMNKLFGQSASGFASGEDSMENYNAMIDVEIRDKVKAILRKVVALRCRQLWGFEPKFTVKFKPLRVLTGVEEETVKTSKQNRALALYDRDLVSGEEASEILHKDGLLTIQTEVGQGLRDPISPLEMEQQASEDAAKADEQKAKGDAKKKENGLARLAAMLGDRRRAA